MKVGFDVDKNAPVIKSKALTVFYDGECPMCTREICMYRSFIGAESIKWVNLSELPDGDIVPGVTKENALARFHAIDDNGYVYVGGAAFAAIWCMLPKFRLLGGLCTRWPLRVFLHYSYRFFLTLRPFLQVVWHARSNISKRAE